MSPPPWQLAIEKAAHDGTGEADLRGMRLRDYDWGAGPTAFEKVAAYLREWPAVHTISIGRAEYEEMVTCRQPEDCGMYYAFFPNWNRLGERGARALAAVPSLRTVRARELMPPLPEDEPFLEDESLAWLPALLTSPYITSLDLSDNMLQDRHAMLVAAAPPPLSRVDMSGNILKGEGVWALLASGKDVDVRRNCFMVGGPPALVNIDEGEEEEGEGEEFPPKKRLRGRGGSAPCLGGGGGG